MIESFSFLIFCIHSVALITLIFVPIDLDCKYRGTNRSSLVDTILYLILIFILNSSVYHRLVNYLFVSGSVGVSNFKAFWNQVTGFCKSLTIVCPPNRGRAYAINGGVMAT